MTPLVFRKTESTEYVSGFYVKVREREREREGDKQTVNQINADLIKNIF